MAGEILGEERVGFRSCQRFLDVVAMLLSWPGKGKERRGELHFGIIAAKPDSLLHESVAVDPASRILRRRKPLLVGFREIARIKIVESGRSTGLRRFRARGEPSKEILCGGRVFAGVERGATKRFHVHEDTGICGQDGERVRGKLGGVIALGAGEIPTVADPRKGLCRADVKGVANESWSGEGHASYRDQQCQETSGETTGAVETGFHKLPLLVGGLRYVQEDGGELRSVNVLLRLAFAAGPGLFPMAPEGNVAKVESVPPGIQHGVV